MVVKKIPPEEHIIQKVIVELENDTLQFPMQNKLFSNPGQQPKVLLPFYPCQTAKGQGVSFDMWL